MLSATQGIAPKICLVVIGTDKRSGLNGRAVKLIGMVRIQVEEYVFGQLRYRGADDLKQLLSKSSQFITNQNLFTTSKA